MIARLFALLRGLLRRRQIEAEIAEELRDHLEREIEGRSRTAKLRVLTATAPGGGAVTRAIPFTVQ
jgi:hypothetical protein